jgi:hypothetical protein
LREEKEMANGRAKGRGRGGREDRARRAEAATVDERRKALRQYLGSRNKADPTEPPLVEGLMAAAYEASTSPTLNPLCSKMAEAVIYMALTIGDVPDVWKEGVARMFGYRRRASTSSEGKPARPVPSPRPNRPK